MPQSIKYGKYEIGYTVVYSDRKTMGIEVHPDQDVVVRAPVDADHEKIKEKLNKRARWILKQLRFFRGIEHRPVTKEYVSGETHKYLGRQYRLKVVEFSEVQKEHVKLKGKYFWIFTHDKQNPQKNKRLLENWYRAHGQKKIQERFDKAINKLQAYGIPTDARWQFRSMPKRWGSWNPSGTILLHPDLIKAPIPCIDYVIYHELAHFKHPNHSQRYFDFLRLVMPDWERRKGRLEND